MNAPTLPAPSLFPARRDSLPVWVLALLILFGLMRLADVVGAGHASGHAAARTVSKSDGNLDSDSMQDLIEADLQAKRAFVPSTAKAAAPGAVVCPNVPALRAALKAAETLLRESRSPGAARRVILLRALLGPNSVPPLASSRGFAVLDAFTTSLPDKLPAQDKARYAAEGRLWQTIFEGGALSPHQTQAAADAIVRLPNIRWWKYPALFALYQGQGDASEAARYAREAQQHTVSSLLPLGLVGGFRIVMILLGLLLLLYLLARGKPAPGTTDLWPTVPPALPDSERRLGAGDLMAVFVVYLLAREVIGDALAGIGVPHVFYVRGLLAPFRPALAQMPASARITVSIGLESAVYLLSAVPPALYLWSMARRRGASLAREIGWRARPIGANLLYGVGGFAVALALMVPAALIGRALFRHAPDPSNPVIPQLVGASGIGTTLLLVALASIAAPLVEELLFRGVFYQAARLKLGVWPAIIVTGLVFGFVHPVGIVEMLAIGVLGGVFAWMAETRKSLLPSMAAHCLQNLTTTLLLLLILAG